MVCVKFNPAAVWAADALNGKKRPGVVVNELGHGQSSALYITEVNVNQCGIGSKMSSGGNSPIRSPLTDSSNHVFRYYTRCISNWINQLFGC